MLGSQSLVIVVTLLPNTIPLLKPQYATKVDAQAIQRLKEKQRFYYNRHVKPLPPLSPGETVRMQLPGEKTWSPGICVGQSGPRSYNVKVGEQEYRRNRRQVMQTKEPQALPDLSRDQPRRTHRNSHSEIRSERGGTPTEGGPSTEV